MIGALLAVACVDRAVLARIAGPIGESARRAATDLATASPDERRRLRARMLAGATAPLPTGIRGAHPSWIEAGLVGLPERARHAIASGTLTAVDVWLARWACAEIPPLPATSDRPVGSVYDAIRLPGDKLVAWLSEIGADQLAFALRAAGPDALARVAASAPDRALGARLAVAAARLDRPPRLDALGPVRAAIARCRLERQSREDRDGIARAQLERQSREDRDGIARAQLELDVTALVRIGARAIAPYVDALAARQLTVRMPHSLGLAVRRELVTHASTPVDRCPTWRALAAVD
ncbi:MAG: hypothetical protein H6Q90_2571 [Deltaproteobacteria bacterium]|nr:hypothetical protein [Deltaproteobacteria bacterium]